MAPDSSSGEAEGREAREPMTPAELEATLDRAHGSLGRAIVVLMRHGLHEEWAEAERKAAAERAARDARG